jgi:SLT domain-containing protein
VKESSLGRGSAARTAKARRSETVIRTGRSRRRRTAGRQLVAVAADDLPFAVPGATVAALTTGQSWLDALLDTLKMRRR